VPVVQQKEKCGWFAPVCNGWQRSMEWVHENQDTLGHIAIDLIEIDAGASLITGGATLAAGGGVLEVGGGGLATVIAVPAAAVGVTGVAAGGGLVAHGSWNLGKDVGDLQWNDQATGSGGQIVKKVRQPVNKMSSAIEDDLLLKKEAQKAGRSEVVKRDLDNMFERLESGNMNPGLDNGSLTGWTYDTREAATVPGSSSGTPTMASSS
jgi:hypothetical protein